MHYMSTEGRYLEDARRYESARRTMLAEAPRALAASSQDLDEEVKAIAPLASQFLGDGFIVFLLSPDGLWLQSAAIYHPSSDTVTLTKELLQVLPIRVGEGLSGQVAHNGQPIVFSELTAEVRKIVGP